MDEHERNLWMDSMDEELQALFDQGTFEFVERSEVEKQGEDIVKTTWAFRKKRKPSGEVYRYKSRLCVRGDLQRESMTQIKCSRLLLSGQRSVFSSLSLW